MKMLYKYTSNNQFKLSRTEVGNLEPLITFLNGNHNSNDVDNETTNPDILPKSDRSAFNRKINTKPPIYIKQNVPEINRNGSPKEPVVLPFATGPVFNSNIGLVLPINELPEISEDQEKSEDIQTSSNKNVAGYSFNGFDYKDR